MLPSGEFVDVEGAIESGGRGKTTFVSHGDRCRHRRITRRNLRWRKGCPGSVRIGGCRRPRHHALSPVRKTFVLIAASKCSSACKRWLLRNLEGPQKAEGPPDGGPPEGEKAHGHCAVGLELFPRAQFSGVLKASQAGKVFFTSTANYAESSAYEKSTDICNVLHYRLLSVTVEVLCIDRLTG